MKLLEQIRAAFGRLFRRPAPAAAAGAGAAAVLSAAVAFIAPWEGLRLRAYLDVAGVPTVCYGETRGVRLGDQYTEAQCRAMLAEAVATFRDGLVRCVPDVAAQSTQVQVALVSWTYNVGIGAACTSTLARLANAGDWGGACRQLPRWNRAGGEIVYGLTRRRASERELCLDGVAGNARVGLLQEPNPWSN